MNWQNENVLWFAMAALALTAFLVYAVNAWARGGGVALAVLPVGVGGCQNRTSWREV